MNEKSDLMKEENEILEAYERGELESVLTPDMRKAHVTAARRTFKKDKRVNIRMSHKDLELLQERALREGIPYQTLMSSVLHKFVNGGLIDRNAQHGAAADPHSASLHAGG
jgi:predicted DNA binding CopG/RHH family protein